MSDDSTSSKKEGHNTDHSRDNAGLRLFTRIFNNALDSLGAFFPNHALQCCYDLILRCVVAKRETRYRDSDNNKRC